MFSVKDAGMSTWPSHVHNHCLLQSDHGMTLCTNKIYTINVYHKGWISRLVAKHSSFPTEWLEISFALPLRYLWTAWCYLTLEFDQA